MVSRARRRRIVITIATGVIATVIGVSSAARVDAAALPVVAVDLALTPDGSGYWLLDDFGRVFALGGAPYLGGSPLLGDDESAVAIAPTPTGVGYRIVTSLGRVFAYGDAVHHGDLVGVVLNGPIIAAAATASGDGYHLLGAEGGVFTFGDAVFAGSIQGIVDELVAPGFPAASWLDAPIVGIAATTSGQGYWLAAADGGMFSFGDAAFHGSVPGVLPEGTGLDAPIVAMAPQAAGYLLVASDGGVFNFGVSDFHGSIPGLVGQGANDIAAATVVADRSGYSMLGSGGAIWPFGSGLDELSDIVAVDVSASATPGDVRDCGDFVALVEAQQWFDLHRPFHGDVALLDDDNDGKACENDLVDVEAALVVAFIGDTSIGADAVSVLELIRDRGADMVIHLGDFDYVDDPAAFEAHINAVLGADFPYFAAVGNHDIPKWGDYQQNFVDRLGRIEGASCSGEYGVNATCTYRGLRFLLSGVGTLGTGHEGQIEAQLASDDHLWRVCAWHKNQHGLQVGAKIDEVGWTSYETCRRGGAIIATGHEHSYSRTRTLTDVESQTVDDAWPDAGAVRVGQDSTFAFVSGLGGHSIRPQLRCQPASPPYGCGGEWASISSSSNGARAGALFIELHVDGDRRAGRGSFIDIDGLTVDTFTITNQNERT